MIAAALVEAAPPYVLLGSQATGAGANWQRVIGALEEKYPRESKVTFPDGDPTDALAELQGLRPHDACVLAGHPEVTREFVTQGHQLEEALSSPVK